MFLWADWAFDTRRFRLFVAPARPYFSGAILVLPGTMTEGDDFLVAALKNLDPKPDDDADSGEKKNYSEAVSQAIADAFGAEMRRRGMKEAVPAPPGAVGTSGAEKRISGGVGAKKVDVSWSTEESGLMAAFSIKTINFRDMRTGNFQKNLTNRRGDMLFEAVTLHRRFPFAVLFGFFVFNWEAREDDTDRRDSTFHNAHQRLELFTGRDDPEGREEQYERLYICLIQANPFEPKYEAFEAGDPDNPISIEEIFDEMVDVVAERNNDFYEDKDGELNRFA